MVSRWGRVQEEVPHGRFEKTYGSVPRVGWFPGTMSDPDDPLAPHAAAILEHMNAARTP